MTRSINGSGFVLRTCSNRVNRFWFSAVTQRRSHWDGQTYWYLSSPEDVFWAHTSFEKWRNTSRDKMLKIRVVPSRHVKLMNMVNIHVEWISRFEVESIFLGKSHLDEMPSLVLAKLLSSTQEKTRMKGLVNAEVATRSTASLDNYLIIIFCILLLMEITRNN